MIDHLMLFDSEAQAQADAVAGAYFVDGAWRGDVCFAAQQVWRADATTVDPAAGATVTHPLPGWYITIGAAGVLPALRDHPRCVLVVDREAEAAGGPASRRILGGTLAGEDLGSYRIAPLPAGARNPFGTD